MQSEGCETLHEKIIEDILSFIHDKMELHDCCCTEAMLCIEATGKHDESIRGQVLSAIILEFKVVQFGRTRFCDIHFSPSNQILKITATCLSRNLRRYSGKNTL